MDEETETVLTNLLSVVILGAIVLGVLTGLGVYMLTTNLAGSLVLGVTMTMSMAVVCHLLTGIVRGIFEILEEVKR